MKNIRSDYDEFGDDFEVTYTEEIPPVHPDADPYRTSYDRYPDSFDESKWYEDDDYEDDYEDDYYEDDFEDYCQDDYEDDYREHRARSRRRQYDDRSPARGRRRSKRCDELDPQLENMVQTGTSVVEKLSRLIFRPAPVLMSGIILLITGFFYWTESAAYGNLDTLTTEPDLILISYLVIGASVLLWELSSFFFILSGIWSRSGRGVTFFIIIYILSYIASLAGRMIPDTLSFAEGIKGGLDTFGSIYSMIFPFCIVGLIACILQKILGRR